MLAEYLLDLKLSGYELATQFQASSFRWNLTHVSLLRNSSPAKRAHSVSKLP